jgi:hypothetical protein
MQRKILDVLNIYCRASGEQLNVDKSSIHFAEGVPLSLRQEINNQLEFIMKL